MDDARGEGAVLSVIRTVAETGSTNADLLELAHTGIEEGFWLRADRQTGGRGRQGRAWESPVGNLYASTIVRLRPGDPLTPTLALAVVVAVEEAVSAYASGHAGRRAEIKWPNDLLIAGAKLAGILLERAGDVIVIGIGANLAYHPEGLDRPVTSLAAHGVHVAPADFLETLADSFARWLGIWRGEGLAPVRQRWLERAHPIGTALTARLPDGEAIEGLFDGLDGDGALILRLASGERRVIHAGDVFLI